MHFRCGFVRNFEIRANAIDAFPGELFPSPLQIDIRVPLFVFESIPWTGLAVLDGVVLVSLIRLQLQTGRCEKCNVVNFRMRFGF